MAKDPDNFGVGFLVFALIVGAILAFFTGLLS